MEYPTLAPTLSALNSVLTSPADNETASKWPAVDRQTRNWLYSFVAQYFDTTTGKLKPFAYGDGTVPFGSVRGSNPANGTQREIVQGSILTADLANEAVDTSKIKANAITDTLIADAAISGTKIKVNSLPADRLQAQSIPGSALGNAIVEAVHLANNAVTEAKIQDLAVTAKKLATRSVDGDRLVQAEEGFILVGGNTVNGNTGCMVPKQMKGGASIDKDGNVTVSATVFSDNLSFARIVEKNGSGAHAGGSNTAPSGGSTTSIYGYAAATPWQARGMGAPWAVLNAQNIVQRIELTSVIETIRNGSGVAVDYTKYQKRIYIQQPGTYLIILEVPGVSCGNHRSRLVVMGDPNAPTNFVTEYGSTAQTPTGAQSNSTLQTLITIGAVKDGLYPYLYVDWRCDTAIASYGMGYASGYGIDEYFATMTLIRLA